MQLFIKFVYFIFLHLVVCLTTGPKPLPKRALHIVRSRVSSIKWEYPLLSLRSSNSFLRLLPCLPITSIRPCIFPSVTRCRRQFHIYIYIYIYIYEAQHVSGDTPPIIRSLRLHYQPLVLNTWRVVGRVVAGRRQACLPDSVQQLHVQQPTTYAKPEAASAVLGSWWLAVCRPKHVELHIYIYIYVYMK